MASPLRSPMVSSPLAATPTNDSQYPFPITAASQRQNPLTGGPRRGSTASTASSLGSALDGGRKLQASIPESSQNAISTLLQHPIMRTGLQAHAAVSTSGYKAPTQKDIPPVALTNITHIESKAFHPYLVQVGSLYEAFQRAKLENEGEATLFQRDKKDTLTEDWETVLSKRIQRPAHSRSSSSVSTILSPSEQPQPKKRQSGQRRQTITPLSTIPSVYSEDDFHLENPRTFDIVSEHSELVRDPKAAPTGRKSLATNAILQEKLSWYMDTVEVHLISSISTASKSFFSALGSLRELHAEAAESIDRIQRLRKELSKLDKDMAMDGLKVVNLRQRRQNVRKLAEAIMQLEDIFESLRACEKMVEQGEIDGALDDLDSVEQLISGKSNPTLEHERPERYVARDLRNIEALNGALDDIGTIRLRVGKGYENRFLNSLLGDVREHVRKTEISTTLERWGIAFNRPKPGQRRGPSQFPGYMNIGNELRADLEAEMRGLARAKHTTPAATSFRAAVLREMKSMIRKQLPSSNDDDAVSTVSASTIGGRSMSQQEKSSILARNLRALDPEDWYKMLATIYANASEALRRLSIQVKILLDITSNLPDSSVKSPAQTPELGSAPSSKPSHGRPRSTSTVQAEMQQALDLSSLLGEGVDLVQNQLIKVVRVRSQQNAELPLIDFIRYFTLNRLFADECEAISGRSGAGLKSALDTQIKDFVTKFAESSKANVVKVLDADKWDAKDFADFDNEILERVSKASTEDSPAWLQSTLIWASDPSALPSTSNGVTTSTTTNNPATATTNGVTQSTKDKVRPAALDTQKFILPVSPAHLLHTIHSFLHLTTCIPFLTPDIATHLLDTLKLFNSRSSQLILGAGATRSAGLKNITTKHLALSSQGLGFVVALIPYLREFFRRKLGNSTAAASQQGILPEFDSVKRRFQEHQLAIHDKLIEIMSGRASMHVKAMKAIDFDEAAKANPTGVSPYMETLVKETSTLQKVLGKHLPEEAVRGIMGPVFESYGTLLAQGIGMVRIGGERGKERLLADAQFFADRVSKIEGSADVGRQIVNAVKNKEVSRNTDVDDTPVSVAAGGGGGEVKPQTVTTAPAPTAGQKGSQPEKEKDPTSINGNEGDGAKMTIVAGSRRDSKGEDKA